MTIEKTTNLYEILIRMNSDGTVRGAHTIQLERVIDGEDLLSEKEMPAQPLDPGMVAETIGAHSAAIIADNAGLRDEIEATKSAKAKAETALAAALSEHETALATALSEHETALAAKNGDIAALEARIAELTTPAPDGSRRIAGAYFRSALIEMGQIENVRAAISDPVKLELFNTATEFNDDDDDVKEIALALKIDLAAVFDVAETIKLGRNQ